MSKKMRLTLEGLKVQSFVTNIDKEKKKALKAGGLSFPSFGPTWCGGAKICDDTFFVDCSGWTCHENDHRCVKKVEPK